MNVYISEEKHISKRICQHSFNCIIAITCIFVFVGSIFKLTISWNFFRTTMFIFNLTSLIATIIVTLIVLRLKNVTVFKTENKPTIKRISQNSKLKLQR